MPLGVVLVSVLIVGMWVAVLSSWRMRSSRVILALVLATIVIVVAGLLPSPLGAIAQGGSWAAATLLLLLKGDHLGLVDQTEGAFLERLDALLRRLAAVKQTALVTDPSESIAEYEAISRAFDELDAPGTDWAELIADMSSDVHRRLDTMQAGRQPTPEALSEAAERWTALETRFERLMNQRRRFWARAPLDRTR